MESSEKIINNCDVLESIFHYLDFKEHLKLIKICPQFEYAIVHGVWRLMCKNLYIWDKFSDTLFLRYNAVNNVNTECSLTLEELHIIFHNCLMYIRKLKLNHICSIRIKSVISLKYHRLTELTLFDTAVEDTHVQQVAENCLNLQSFSLINFTNSINHSNIRVNVFGEMKALNKLEIHDMSFDAWNYFDVQQLFSLHHLKTLSINIRIRDSNDYNGNINNSTVGVYNIQNLTIGELYGMPVDLIRFKNLTKLCIILNRVSIDDNVLAQINNACPKLCELSFTSCYFTLNEFPRMNNLKHLTFRKCENISLKHFDEIFRKHKIKSLSLVDVQMRYNEDITDYNYISNTLETLTIKYVRSVITFFNQQHKFENVSKISILGFISKSTGLCFSHNFPYLRELISCSIRISSEDILNLKHLKVLQFDLFDDMFWPYLEILFQHPTLTHITITPSLFQNFKEHYERSPVCCEGLTTTLEYLSLPSAVYEMGLSFWPSFRQRNKLLKLEIVGCRTLKRKAAAM